MSVDLLSQNPVFADLEPIDLVEPEGALVPILYSNDYKEAMGYFRALTARQEYSERVLDVTLRVIRLNPAHYTVWQYRFRTLLELGKSLPEELELMNCLAEANMKSYQVWHHRLLLLTHLPPPISPATIHAELDFISGSLLPDSKNYHTWAYRQFVLTHFAALLTDADWESEVRWTDTLLRVEGAVGGETEAVAREDEEDLWEEDTAERDEHEGDVRNNSAWTHRWFLSFGRVGAPGATALEREVEYTKSQLKLVPNNASAWSYLRGLHNHFDRPYSSESPFAQELKESCASRGGCAGAVEWLVDASEQAGDVAAARAYFEELKTVDPIRRLFWAHRQAGLAASADQQSATGSVPTSRATPAAA